MSKELYFVIDRDGTLLQRRSEDMTKAETVKDILSGQFASVGFIYCINPEEGSCRDVTEDVAREVLNESGCTLRGAALDLVEDRVGISAAREAGRGR